MASETPKKKIAGVLLPADKPLRMKSVIEGLYVAEDDPYTDRYGYFESSRLYRKKPHRTVSGRAGKPAVKHEP
jgi:hypothetical protein